MIYNERNSFGSIAGVWAAQWHEIPVNVGLYKLYYNSVQKLLELYTIENGLSEVKDIITGEQELNPRRHVTERYQGRNSSPGAPLSISLGDAAILAIIYPRPQSDAHWSGKATKEWRWSSRPPETPLELYILHTQLHSCQGTSRSEVVLIWEHGLRSADALLSFKQWTNRPTWWRADRYMDVMKASVIRFFRKMYGTSNG